MDGNLLPYRDQVDWFEVVHPDVYIDDIKEQEVIDCESDWEA